VDPAYISAGAALAGSAVGGLISFLAAQLGQKAQFKTQLFLNDKSRREDLYRNFVDEASRLYIDSLIHDTPDLSKMVALYATMISRMRVVSSPSVVGEAEKVAVLVVECYAKENITYSDVRAMVSQHAFDPLRHFAEACRQEFAAMEAS